MPMQAGRAALPAPLPACLHDGVFLYIHRERFIPAQVLVGGDGEQGVLPPAPCGILVVEDHVPVGVCGGAVAEVVVDQVEDVLRVLPAVVAGAAFGLRLDQFDLRP